MTLRGHLKRIGASRRCGTGILLNFEGEAEGVDVDRIVEDVLAELPEVPDEVTRLGS